MKIALSSIRPYWSDYLITQLLRFMKLTGILLLAACLHLFQQKGIGQKVTYSAKKVSLQEVFREIIKQTGYSIIYNEKLIQKSKSY